MPENPSPGPGADRACRPCASGDVKCWNGPLCKWRSVGTCRFQHQHEEGELVIEQRQVPNDITTGLNRVVCLLEDMLLLMKSTVQSRQRYQSQAGDKWDTQHTTEEEYARPAWEVLETKSPALSFHSYDAEPNLSSEVLGTPEEATPMQDKLRWPYRAVSKEWQAMSWKWLEPDTGGFPREAAVPPWTAFADEVEEPV